MAISFGPSSHCSAQRSESAKPSLSTDAERPLAKVARAADAQQFLLGERNGKQPPNAELENGAHQILNLCCRDITNH